MYDEKKTVIGFMTDNIYSDFAKEIASSIVRALPQNRNIRLIMIAGMKNESEDVMDNKYCYDLVYNSIYRLTEMCKLDGLIITMGSKRIEDIYSDTRAVDIFKDIPKVYISSYFDDEITVNYNNETGIREALNCLVNVNGFSKICMLGGREDHRDSNERKRIFMKCLEENRITFQEKNYERTDMSSKCHEAARRLLDNNPDAEAIFCVNDDVAKGLYEVMGKRGLVPGKDIYVFGFDNTHSASEMLPSLTSIGSDADAIGQKAVKLLFDKMSGKKVRSVVLPTRLYGRDSFTYRMYEYTTLEMVNVDKAFIYRMFDDCFYRYRGDRPDRTAINLRRLFFEFISRMLYAMKKKYMDVEEFEEIGRMIDIFFDNGAMEYTDASKLIASIEKLQGSVNGIQKSIAANVMNNRLFLRMKDRAIKAQWNTRIKEKTIYAEIRRNMQDFLVETMDFQNEEEEALNNVVKNFGKLGLRNAAFYMYESTVEYKYGKKASFPGLIRLKCVTKGGELFVMSRDRQECPVSSIFLREELSPLCKGFVAFPIFYCQYIYGILVCELTADMIGNGEYVAGQLGRVIYNNVKH